MKDQLPNLEFLDQHIQSLMYCLTSYPSGSSITPDSIADNQIVFTVPASVITAANGTS